MSNTDCTDGARILDDYLVQQIMIFNEKRKRDKRRSSFICMSTAACATLTTVALGYQSPEPAWQAYLKNAALVLSAAATFLATYDALFDHKALWIRYSQTLAELELIRAEFQSKRTSQAINQQDLETLHERARNCVLLTNTWWVKLRLKNDPGNLAA